jgi:membrane-bound lytic murein transglycosylase D
MGMGWNILRRKPVALVCCLLGAAGFAHGQVAARLRPAEQTAMADFRLWAQIPVVSFALEEALQAPARGQGRPEMDAGMFEAAEPPRVVASTEPAPAGSSSLPAVQSHRGVELYTIAAPDEAIVDSFLDGYLAKKRDWLQGVLDRIPTYRIVIASEISRLGLPRELQYLPAVESGFQAKALSPRGASGLWQLMSNTASPSGLAMDQWIDERRDFYKATEASLKKLAADYRYFGDWYLALAAYNCGASRLARIVRESGVSDFWVLRKKGFLPRETASFVPQFLALAKIFSYPGRYGLELSWDGAIEWTRVAVGRSVDLGILSRQSGVPLEVLKAGNAELRMSVTPPQSYTYMLKVPVEYEIAVRDALGNASRSMVELSIHVVRSGDTLSGIARDYGVALEWIMELNPTVKPLTLQIGSRILVPRPGMAEGGQRRLDGTSNAASDAGSRPEPGGKKGTRG